MTKSRPLLGVLAVIKEDPRKYCDCGEELSGEDAAFWAECRLCRKILPLSTAQSGDAGSCAGAADRQYHGGQGSKGEW